MISQNMIISSRERRVGGRNNSIALLVRFVRVLGLAVFILSLSVLNRDSLPDYEAYSEMFSGSFIFIPRYFGFSVVALTAGSLGLTYEGFRIAILLFGSILTYWLSRATSTIFDGGMGRRRQKRPNSLMFFVLVFMFILEFYLIRLRAGLSIFFFSASFLLFLYGSRYASRVALLRLLQLGLLLMSAVVHAETFAALTLFVLFPLAWAHLAAKKVKSSSRVFFSVMLLLWAMLFWTLSHYGSDVRGEHLNSELNFVRFLLISPLPIALWPYVRSKYLSSDSVYNPGWRKWRRGNFSYLFALNYIAMAVTLALFFFAGQLNTAGEAVVRIVSLSSLGAILSVSWGGATKRNGMAIYIIACNALFFLNTLFL